QKMEAIGQLSGGIAHDFNNQLGVIIGYLDFLKKHVAGEEKPAKWVDTAVKATQRCMDLTRQLLAFSRRESPAKTIVDLNAMFQELETMIARSVTPEVEVQYFPADGLWLTEIDPGEFQDAILNLVINARDAMPGGGKLLIETGNKRLDADYAALNPGVEPGDYVQLMLSDTGAGMDQQTLEHVFEPFFTTKPKGKGTGLGMAMVYGFVKRYGGYIKVYSEPGVGTSIRIYLPRSPASEAPLPANNGQTAELPTGSESILIVDDEPDLLTLAGQYLGELGYCSRTAANAARALEILEGDGSFDLLFSDVVMPGGMNGYELARRATRLRPGLKVLLTSGFTSKAMAPNGLGRFSAHLLGKPYRKADLARRVRLVLDGGTGA
ncbi:MAG TPA: response regulator, partial [Sedimenticola sp.]|nr:response regulator [Sedimenticola sp.]